MIKIKQMQAFLCEDLYVLIVEAVPAIAFIIRKFW